MISFGNLGPGFVWCPDHWLGISGFASVPVNDLEIIGATGVQEVDGAGALACEG